MTVSLWQQECADAERLEARDVVVGGGIVGSYLARHLSERGREVVLLERNEIAAGASGRNGGFVMCSTRDSMPELISRIGPDAASRVMNRARRNVAKMRKLAGEFGVEVGPAPLRLAESQEDLSRLQAWAGALTKAGVAASFEASDPLDAGFVAHMRVEGDFVTQPASLTRALARASGAKVIPHSEVYGFESRGASLIVHSRRAQVQAERAWVCVNGYVPALLPELAGIVAPKRGQMIVTGPSDAQIACSGISRGGYFRPLSEGRVAIGGARAAFVREESTSEDLLNPQIRQRLLTHLARRFPDTSCEVVAQWAGVQGFTADRRPLLGCSAAHPQVAFAAGFSGYGNGLGIECAELLAAHVLEGAGLEEFDARREQPPGLALA